MPYPSGRRGGYVPIQMPLPSDSSTLEIDVATLDSQQTHSTTGRLLHTQPQHHHAPSSLAYVPPSPSSAPSTPPVQRRVSASASASAPTSLRTSQPFTVFAAANVFGASINIELPFLCKPGLSELTELCQRVFSMERAVARASAAPMSAPFRITHLSLFNSSCNAWEQTTQGTAISHGAQFYVHQEEIEGVHSEGMQQAIPPPTLPMKAALSPVECERSRACAVFEEADINGKGTVDLQDLRRLLSTLHIHFADNVVSSMFDEADMDNTGLLYQDDFIRLCTRYPTFAECCYFRSRDFWEDYQLRQDLEGSVEMLALIKESAEGKKRQQEGSNTEVRSVCEKLREVDKALHEQRSNEQRCEAKVEAADKDVNAVAHNLRDVDAEQKVAKDKVSAVKTFLESAERERSKCESNLTERQATLQDKIIAERSLRQALEDATREVERQKRLVTSSTAEVKKIHSKINKAKGELESVTIDSHGVASKLQELTAVSDTLNEKRTEAVQQLEYEQHSTQQVVSLKQSLQEKLAFVKEEEGVVSHAANVAADAVAKQERIVHTLEEECQATATKRQKIEQEETPLLEQELQLKMQRENIKQQENQLRLDTSGYFKVCLE